MPRGRARSPYLLATVLSMAAAPWASSHAQTAPEPPAPRTGPNARMPDFGYVEPTPLTPAPPHVELAAPTNRATLLVSDIRIQVEGVSSAVWRPTPHAPDVLELSHHDGELLDAAWVRGQFDARRLIDARVAVSSDAIVGLVQLINRAYLENGYVNSGLIIEGYDEAQQRLLLKLIFGGIAQPITVNWGAESEFEAARHGLGAEYVLDRLSAARTSPFNMTDMEVQFRRLAADPAVRTVNANVRPSQIRGIAELDLRVAPQSRFDLYLSAANSRSPSVGGERAAIGGSIRNVVFDGSLLSAEYGVTEGLSDALVGYQTPLFTPRLSFDVRADANDADVVEPALRPLGINSNSRNVEAGITYRLIDSPLMPGDESNDWKAANSLALGARIARKRSESFLLGMPFSFSPGSVNGVTEITVGRLTADWISRDNEGGRGRVWALSTTASVGLEGSRSDVPSVLSPDENFSTVVLQLNHARQLGEKIEVRARLVGQWASGLVYSSERFVAGGESTVRGYRENLILADEGVASSIEISRSFDFNGGRRTADGTEWGAVRAGLFLDAAFARQRAGAAADPESIASVGVALAWNPSNAVSARLAYAHALEDVPLQGDELADNGVHFAISFRPLAAFDNW